MKMQLAWHHTDLARVAYIMKDGFIRPSRINPPGSKIVLPSTAAAVVWLTTDHRGDPVAAATRGGLPPVRLGLPLSVTLSPAALVERHGWTEARVREDAALGLMRGSKPDQWRVVVGPVPVVDVVAQVRIRQEWRGLHQCDLDISPWAQAPDAIRVCGYGLDMVVVPIHALDGRRGYAVRSTAEPQTSHA